MYGYEKPSIEASRRFGKRIMDAGLHVRVRKEFGDDIAAACGQLALVKTSNPQRVQPTDIEDIASRQNNVARRKRQEKRSERLSKPRRFAKEGGTFPQARCAAQRNLVALGIFIMTALGSMTMLFFYTPSVAGSES